MTHFQEVLKQQIRTLFQRLAKTNKRIDSLAQGQMRIINQTMEDMANDSIRQDITKAEINRLNRKLEELRKTVAEKTEDKK